MEIVRSHTLDSTCGCFLYICTGSIVSLHHLLRIKAFGTVPPSSTGIINSIIDFVCMNYHATNGKHIPPARRKLRKQMNFNGCLHIDTHDWQSDKMDPVSIFVAECVKNVRRKLSGNSLPEVMVRAVW